MVWAPFAVAEEKGFFKDEGLNVKVVVFPSPLSRYNAFMVGNTHFSTGMVGDYTSIAAKGYPISIVMETNLNFGHMVIIKNEFNDLTELRGKTIACEIGTVDHLFLLKTLEEYGLTADDVKIVNMTIQEGPVAFIRGTVDGVVTWQPFTFNALKRGGGKSVMTSRNIPIILNGIHAQTEILGRNPDMVVKVLRSYFKGLKWGEEHPDKYCEIANKKLFYESPQTKEDLIRSQSLMKMLKPEEIKEGMKDGGSLYQHCQEVLDFYYDQGMIDSKPDPASFINNELYLKAIEAYYE
jgi:NitT/TauT family transport system substrate-binding protein